MDKAQLIALYDQDQRIAVEYPDSRREVTQEVVRHVDISDFRQGHVIYSQLSEDNADEIIREQIAFFEHLGQDFEWKLFEHDRPSDLKERLVAHGFTVEDAGAPMVPASTVPMQEVGEARKVLRLLDLLEDNDDVQDVYANFDIPEQVLEAVAS